MTARRNRCRLFLCFFKLLRPLWISNLIVVEIYDRYFLAVFYFTCAKIVQKRTPLRVLLQVLGDMFRKQNVSGIAAIHYSLRDIDAGAGDVRLLVQIADLVNRTAVNPHPDAKFWIIL